MATGKREKNKQRTREALEAAAWDLIAERGFDGTTVAAIAERVQVVERTFYRYFECKEAVLFGAWREQLDEFEEFIRRRPAGETVLQSLTEFSRAWATVHQATLQRSRQRRAIARESSTVRDYERIHIVETLRNRVLLVVSQRLGAGSAEDYRVPLLTALFIELLVSTKARWLESGGSLLREVELAWRAMNSLRDLEKS